MPDALKPGHRQIVNRFELLVHRLRRVPCRRRSLLHAKPATTARCRALRPRRARPPRPPTLPTALIYDHDRDTWRVEVGPIEGDPEYLQTLPIYTESASDRREGLIPPAKYRTLTPHGGRLTWRGPVAVRHEKSFWRDNPWRVQRFNMKLPISHDPDTPIEIDIRLDDRFADPWPRYHIRVRDAGYAR